MVEGELYPASSVLLSGCHVTLYRGHGRALLGVGWRPGRERVGRRDRLGEHGLVVDARAKTPAVVSAVLDDLRRDSGVEIAERIGERLRLEAVRREVHPILADLEPGVSELELLEVDVVDCVAAYVIARSVQLG